MQEFLCHLLLRLAQRTRAQDTFFVMRKPLQTLFDYRSSRLEDAAGRDESLNITFGHIPRIRKRGKRLRA